jgi:hypothetical protein
MFAHTKAAAQDACCSAAAAHNLAGEGSGSLPNCYTVEGQCNMSQRLLAGQRDIIGAAQDERCLAAAAHTLAGGGFDKFDQFIYCYMTL